MILPEAPDGCVGSDSKNPIYDGTADPIVVQGTKDDWSRLFKKAVEDYPDPNGDPIELADKIEDLQRGHLYDVLYRGSHETGFFCRFEGGMAIFFCFNLECQGDYLFFPSEEIVVVEHPENLASLARTIYFECDKIRWLIEFMKWDNDANFVVAKARRGMM
ncbi:MAG: hypothetical protein WC919_00775 [Candidatus Paceibacterota bacterium]|jgi:hypothetical protein